jgi:hypothetical protein
MNALMSFVMLGGWLGVVELLWTAMDRYRKTGEVDVNTRLLVYTAIVVAYVFQLLRSLPLPNL